MSATRQLKRILAGAMLSGVGTIATLGLATGLAQALPSAPEGFWRCDPTCRGQWCPGEPLPWPVTDMAKTWDMNVCHDFHQVSGGVYAEGPLPPDEFVCPPFAFMCP
jgi:hypothetical protein